MAARKILARVPLIAFAIATQPAFAQNGNDPSTANPSANPAKRAHKHHHGKHKRRQQTQQQQAPQPGGSN